MFYTAELFCIKNLYFGIKTEHIALGILPIHSKPFLHMINPKRDPTRSIVIIWLENVQTG